VVQVSFPSNLKYTKEHEWVEVNGDVATVGVTDYAVEQLGDVVHIDLPEGDSDVEAGAAFGSIESTKTVSDLYSPVSGRIVDVNEALLDNLEGLSEDAYDEGWLIKIKMTSTDELDGLMSAKDYDDFISQQDS
jgi:glycine cleavage system H protein